MARDYLTIPATTCIAEHSVPLLGRMDDPRWGQMNHIKFGWLQKLCAWYMDGQLSAEDEVMKKYIGDFTFDDDEYSYWINDIWNIFLFIYDYNIWPCISSCGSRSNTGPGSGPGCSKRGRTLDSLYMGIQAHFKGIIRVGGVPFKCNIRHECSCKLISFKYPSIPLHGHTGIH